jgi:hypothetical protein
MNIHQSNDFPHDCKSLSIIIESTLISISYLTLKIFGRAATHSSLIISMFHECTDGNIETVDDKDSQSINHRASQNICTQNNVVHRPS